MSNIERIGTNKRMSQVVKHNETIYLSGQVGNKDTKDLKRQTIEVLEKIDNLLKDAGTDKSKILSATIYLTDINFFEDMNEVWDNWLPQNCAPARATVEAKLALPELLVEICIIATN
jgi:enamine deaminase RidA (YjgF/YER057c/UK114 family)